MMRDAVGPPSAHGQLAAIAILGAGLVCLPAQAAAPQQPPRLAFIGLTRGTGVDAQTVDAVAAFTHTEASRLGLYAVISSEDIKALLGLEAQRALLGCAESSCMAELGGALGVERLLVGDVFRLGDSAVVNLSLLDAQRARTISRVGRRVRGGELDLLLDAIPGLLREAALADEVVRRAALDAFGGPRPFRIGLRLEGELLGPGFAAGVELGVRSRLFGASLAAFPRLTPPANADAFRPLALRAELRAYPFVLGRLRPWIGAGATSFFPEVAARAALGIELPLAPLLVTVDAAFEYVVTDNAVFNPACVLLSAGLAYAF